MSRPDLADEHHPGDVERFGVGHPQPVAKLGFLTQPTEQLADLGATAVDDDRFQPDRAEHHHIFGEGAREVVVDHGVPAELHHDHRAPEPLDVGQRLHQRSGPLFGGSSRDRGS